MNDEKKKEGLNLENCVSKEIEAIESICDKRCKICNSEHIQEIHLLKKNGRQLGEIVALLFEKYQFSISESSLSRHFAKHRERQQLISARIIHDDMIEGATKQAAHAKATVDLIDMAIEQLKERAKGGSLMFDISDLDKLMKLKYQVLEGETDDQSDILQILQKAKVIFNQNQLKIC